jgi:CBS domain-containing protein
MRITNAMTREVLAVPPEAKLSRAADLMTRKRIRHLPVVSGARLVGVLSDRDVLKYEPLEVDDVRVGAAMTPAPITCLPGDTVSHAAAIMLDHKIDCLPIVDAGGSLVGIVTSSDLLLLLVENAQGEALPFDYNLRVVDDGELLEVAS